MENSRQYHATNRLVVELQSMLQKVENGEENSAQFKGEISNKIHLLKDAVEDLEIRVQKEPPQKRPIARSRVQEIIREYHNVKQSFDNVMARARKKEQEEREREELMNMRFKPNSNETAIMIDRALAESQKLNTIGHAMDDLLGSGASILADLRNQRSTLKRAQKKILDIFNTLGLSNTVMRLIERRAFEDKFVLWGGMAGTLFVMWLVYHYLG